MVNGLSYQNNTYASSLLVVENIMDIIPGRPIFLAANSLGMSESTLFTILKNRRKNEKSILECGQILKRRKSIKKLPLKNLEKAHVRWFGRESTSQSL